MVLVRYIFYFQQSYSLVFWNQYKLTQLETLIWPFLSHPSWQLWSVFHSSDAFCQLISLIDSFSRLLEAISLKCSQLHLIHSYSLLTTREFQGLTNKIIRLYPHTLCGNSDPYSTGWLVCCGYFTLNNLNFITLKMYNTTRIIFERHFSFFLPIKSVPASRMNAQAYSFFCSRLGQFLIKSRWRLSFCSFFSFLLWQAHWRSVIPVFLTKGMPSRIY